MSRRTFGIIMSVMVVIIGALIWINVNADSSRETWDICGEFPNRNITWTGAGYNGIFGEK